MQEGSYSSLHARLTCHLVYSDGAHYVKIYEVTLNAAGTAVISEKIDEKLVEKSFVPTETLSSENSFEDWMYSRNTFKENGAKEGLCGHFRG